ncbi:EamA family transporter [Pedobacter yulinensis]|uniref:EamA family transporter n=1 Tax=Pedobacter yulinensis TaxID=2126353 RepID=A0A2T3HJ03_9SPHI|nr:EamA family transporter [Pedobacter yulinensis]PST82435.1 EamA family transporter [Pedobacter yulinensis]
MTPNLKPKAATLYIVIAFAIVYVVWGSTYFFIRMAVEGFPPMLMGAVRYILAGLLLLGWCALRKQPIWNFRDVINSGVGGILMLFIANGIVIWVEQVLPSAMVAIMVSANPVWLVVLDKANWRVNLRNPATLLGLITGFAGVLLLFGQELGQQTAHVTAGYFQGIILLALAPVAWAAGSLWSKGKTSNSPVSVNTAWQMIIAGLAFLPMSALNNEFAAFDAQAVPLRSWLAILYLILFGSIAAFSSYVWLLKVRSATQVGTHSYVNPVIAVLLGVFFAGEHIGFWHIAGLVVILFSVLLINLDKYLKRSLQGSPGRSPFNWMRRRSRTTTCVE